MRCSTRSRLRLRPEVEVKGKDAVARAECRTKRLMALVALPVVAALQTIAEPRKMSCRVEALGGGGAELRVGRE